MRNVIFCIILGQQENQNCPKFPCHNALEDCISVPERGLGNASQPATCEGPLNGQNGIFKKPKLSRRHTNLYPRVINLPDFPLCPWTQMTGDLLKESATHAGGGLLLSRSYISDKASRIKQFVIKGKVQPGWYRCHVLLKSSYFCVGLFSLSR